jgi:hypothetical protein
MASPYRGIDPAWLKTLWRPDRVVAERWLQEVGDVRFARIVAAFQSAARRPRNRPKTIDIPFLRRAWALWLAHGREGSLGQSDEQLDEAAKQAARQIVQAGAWGSRPRITEEALRRKIREDLGTVKASKMLGPSMAAEDQGLPPLTEAEMRSLIQRYAPETDHLMPRMAALDAAAARVDAQRQRLLARLDLERRRLWPSDFDRERRLALFMEAFEGAIDPDMPISRVARLYNDVAAVFRAEWEE